MNGNNLCWFQNGFVISAVNWRPSAAKSSFFLKPSLASNPDLDKINEHARTLSDDFRKVLFRLRETLLFGALGPNCLATHFNRHA